MVFETKKIQLETLSEYLAEVRASFGFSVEEVAEKTSIQPKFLEFLEQNSFHKLPADVYVFGFLRQLGALYAINSQVLIDQYKKERNIAEQLEKKPTFYRSATGRILGKIVITPKYLSVTVGLLFVVLTLGYIIWQVSSINKTPSLQISQPTDRQVIKDSAVTVSGKTDPGMSLTINDQSVFVDSQGSFSKQISIDNGPKLLVFMAKNKFGKSASRDITVIGESPVAVDATVAPGVELKLEFTGSGVLSYVLDSGLEQHLAFTAGDAKVLTAHEQIVVSTTDAGATRAIYNNQNLGALGRPKEKLLNVPFFAQSDTISTSTP